MHAPSQPGETAAIQPHQFSLRSLFTLTLAVALLLSIGYLSRGSRYLGALSSAWAFASLVPGIAVWMLDRFQLVGRGGLVVTSIVVFAASLCTPAINLQIIGDPDVLWGWQAFAISFMVLPEGFYELFRFPSHAGAISWEGFMNLFACLTGAAANIAFLPGLILSLVAWKRGKASPLARRAAILGTSLVLADLALLLLGGDLRIIYPGYGLWGASMLALVLALAARP